MPGTDSPQHLAIVAATGRTGGLAVKQDLTRGHRVASVARRPEQVDVKHVGLKVIGADVSDPASFATR